MDPLVRLITDGDDVREYHPWYPPLDWINYKDSKLFQEKVTYQYLISIYHSVLFLSSNEIGPVDEIELFGSLCILAISIFINTKIFSDLSLLVT